MSGSEPISDVSTWEAPDGSYQILYPLPLLHEIDLMVSDGYRRIPHGGIEVGGILIGHIEGRQIRIEAMRPIECEHAFGPSFKLSELDVETLRNQIDQVGIEQNIARVQAVGWFIAHTRSDLQTTDTEDALFGQLFPQPGQLTLLVKPEKFKPTRFAFLIRNGSGEAPRDGIGHALILPLPGRAGKAAPDAAPTAIRPATPPPVQLVESVSPVASPPPAQPAEQPRSAARATLPLAPLLRDFPPPQQPTRIAPPPPPRPDSAPAVAPPPPVRPENPSEWQDLPRNLRRRAAIYEQEDEAPGVLRREQRGSRPLFWIVVAVAGIAGCVLGYWAYLHLVAAEVTLRVQPSEGKLLVWWPPDQTRAASSVALRINDGAPQTIPASDAAVGRIVIPAEPGGVKLELIAHRPLIDARGIVRFIPAPGPAGR